MGSKVLIGNRPLAFASVDRPQLARNQTAKKAIFASTLIFQRLAVQCSFFTS